MTTHKVADLSGSLLARAVALASSYQVVLEASEWGVRLPNGDARSFSEYGWRPDRDWEAGGPIIEREGIDLYTENGERFADFGHPARHDGVQWTHTRGPTMLVAAMRAYVASKLGETVELP